MEGASGTPAIGNDDDPNYSQVVGHHAMAKEVIGCSSKVESRYADFPLSEVDTRRRARRWLDVAAITEGAIFRQLWKNRASPALSPATVDIVQRRARLAGREEDSAWPSLRSGFVTEASLLGEALPAIMQLTEHRAVSSVIGYFQTGGATASPWARILEG